MGVNSNAYSAYHEWKEWSDESFGTISTELEGVYVALLRKYIPKQSGMVLDFGFGNGEMLATLRKLGFETCGIEINPFLRDVASRKGYVVYSLLTDTGLPANACLDAITAFHVLEHLDKPVFLETMNRFSCLLRPGGVVLAAFPNGDSPFSASAFNGDITHMTLVGSSLADQVGSKFGMKLAAYESFPAVSDFSPSFSVRYKGRIRGCVEHMISQILSKAYYGNVRKVFSPVAIAVWEKM